jgi:hypothetical protein
MAREHPRITDPKRLRALAHPLRWQLLKLVGSEETATATRCAELTGESVASCSYHLNMLAKYGFLVEAEGGQGREKPWRVAARGQTISSDDLDDEGVAAAEAATEAFLTQEFESLRAANRRAEDEPKEWRDRMVIRASSIYVTADEAAELLAKIDALTEEYEKRWENPELRPDGARQVRMFVSTMVEPKPGA